MTSLGIKVLALAAVLVGLWLGANHYLSGIKSAARAEGKVEVQATFDAYMAQQNKDALEQLTKRDQEWIAKLKFAMENANGLHDALGKAQSTADARDAVVRGLRGDLAAAKAARDRARAANPAAACTDDGYQRLDRVESLLGRCGDLLARGARIGDAITEQVVFLQADRLLVCN